ncbi:MAG: hypothetical protein LBG98_03840 [Puniceicoccales bacterium]|jgi:hypothetical protein|nr:hypothetical protein [Puniceicoccales bacterium]
MKALRFAFFFIRGPRSGQEPFKAQRRQTRQGFHKGCFEVSGKGRYPYFLWGNGRIHDNAWKFCDVQGIKASQMEYTSN